jgi:glycosyltransferase involved in cell wall biosynthesis
VFAFDIVSRPTVSVLTTVYDGLPYLREAVESVLDQTFEDFEFIIVDDGSTDGTSLYLETIDDSRLRVLSQNNRGRSASLVRGLDACEGEYVAVLDADDIAHEKRLERSVAYLDANPCVGLLGGAYERQYERDDCVQYTEHVSPPTSHDAIIRELPLRNPFAHSVVMYRREAAVSVGGYRNRHSCIDYDLWVRMACAGVWMSTLDEKLGTIRKHKSRAFDFNLPGRLRYLLDAYRTRRTVVQCHGLDYPARMRASPLLMTGWAITPASFKRPVRRGLAYARGLLS